MLDDVEAHVGARFALEHLTAVDDGEAFTVLPPRGDGWLSVSVSVLPEGLDVATLVDPGSGRGVDLSDLGFEPDEYRADRGLLVLAGPAEQVLADWVRQVGEAVARQFGCALHDLTHDDADVDDADADGGEAWDELCAQLITLGMPMTFSRWRNVDLRQLAGYDHRPWSPATGTGSFTSVVEVITDDLVEQWVGLLPGPAAARLLEQGDRWRPDPNHYALDQLSTAEWAIRQTPEQLQRRIEITQLAEQATGPGRIEVAAAIVDELLTDLDGLPGTDPVGSLMESIVVLTAWAHGPDAVVALLWDRRVNPESVLGCSSYLDADDPLGAQLWEALARHEQALFDDDGPRGVGYRSELLFRGRPDGVNRDAAETLRAAARHVLDHLCVAGCRPVASRDGHLAEQVLTGQRVARVSTSLLQAGGCHPVLRRLEPFRMGVGAGSPVGVAHARGLLDDRAALARSRVVPRQRHPPAPPHIPDESVWWTVHHSAAFLDCTVPQLLERIDAGELAAYRIAQAVMLRAADVRAAQRITDLS